MTVTRPRSAARRAASADPEQSGGSDLEARFVADDSFDDRRLQAAVATVLSAHHLLTAAVGAGTDRPVVLRSVEVARVPLEVVDHRRLGPAERGLALADLLAAERTRIATPEAAPLVRVTAVLETPDGWILVVAAARPAASILSLGTVAALVLAAYRGDAEPTEPAGGSHTAGIDGENHRQPDGAGADFWRSARTGPPGTLPAAWTGASGGELVAFAGPDDQVRDGLRHAAGTIGPEAVLLAVHLAVLRRLGVVGHTDVVLRPAWLYDEAPTCEHTLPRVTVPLPLDLPAAVTWRDALRSAEELQRTAWRHRHSRPLPPDPQGQGAERLGRVLFETRPEVGAAGGGELPLQGDHDCGLHVVADPARMEVHLRDLGRVFAPGRLKHLAELYRTVLETVATTPDGDVRATGLPADERAAVLETWSVGRRLDRGDATIGERIADQAARTPEATAVRASDGTLTYRDLEHRARVVARRLVAAGVGREHIVGVCLRRGVDLLPVLLGIWKAGAAYLPLDPELPAERIGYLLGATGCRIVVAAGALVRVVEPVHDGDVLVLDGLGLPGSSQDPGTGGTDGGPGGGPAGPGNLAYVIYTSGSTGDPKGVMVPHRGLTNYLTWTADAYATGTGGAPVFSSLSFDLGIPDLFTPLLVGQPVHLLPDPLDIAELGRLLAEGGPYSFVKLTPGHLDLLTYQLTPAEIAGLAGLVIAAGDAFTTELAARWTRLAGAGGTQVATEYGPTEITVGNSGQLANPTATTELVPLGSPIPNTTMYVLDEYLEPAPIGVPGEVCIGGVGVARGYLGRPGLTADRFVPDPFGPTGSRLYRSGDLGRWLADGSLEFLGRSDDQVKIRGYRIELGEIRATLCRHPDIRDAAVLATTAASGAVRLVAYVVLAAGRRLDGPRLKRRLAGALPDYMLPHAFVAIDEIPLTRNGKADSRALPVLL